MMDLMSLQLAFKGLKYNAYADRGTWAASQSGSGYTIRKSLEISDLDVSIIILYFLCFNSFNNLFNVVFVDVLCFAVVPLAF